MQRTMTQLPFEEGGELSEGVFDLVRDEMVYLFEPGSDVEEIIVPMTPAGILAFLLGLLAAINRYKK